MKMLRIPLLLIGLLLCSQGFAATAQQNKMATCNADAKTQNLTGDKRQAFMSNCLKAAPAATSAMPAATPAATPATTPAAMPATPATKPATAAVPAKVLTPQQQKMKDCNAAAKTQAPKGDAHKAFMSNCLKKK
ncbi:PsiF family protein [Pseudomonas batumici]|uniref:PsiF family protein n=1 Tax=Pseudomonas batumici TaxID=226910 RepID=UPI0030CB593B